MITNLFTENVIQQQSTDDRQPPIIDTVAHVTLTASPQLTTNVYKTTYMIENTLKDENDMPYVMTSKKTISNTVTAATDYTQFFLQSSEPNILEEYNTAGTSTLKELINSFFEFSSYT